jgi:hypothetical protein
MIGDKARAGKAVALAAVAGGLATGLEVYLVTVNFGWVGAPPPPAEALVEAALIGTSLIPFVALAAGFVFAIGLAVVGLPMWAALHHAGARSRWAAILAGGGLSMLVGAALLTVLNQARLGWDETRLSAFLILPGAIAGWTLHRVAYGRRGVP